MKEFLKRKIAALVAFYENTLKPRVKKAGPVMTVILAIVIGLGTVALAIAFIAAVTFVMVLLPGMLVGFFAWFVWTYMQFGLTYFPSLPPVYQTIPFWHFSFGFAVLILIWRCFRKKGYGKDAEQTKPSGSTGLRSETGNWRRKP